MSLTSLLHLPLAVSHPWESCWDFPQAAPCPDGSVWSEGCATGGDFPSAPAPPLPFWVGILTELQAGRGGGFGFVQAEGAGEGRAGDEGP